MDTSHNLDNTFQRIRLFPNTHTLHMSLYLILLDQLPTWHIVRLIVHYRMFTDCFNLALVLLYRFFLRLYSVTRLDDQIKVLLRSPISSIQICIMVDFTYTIRAVSWLVRMDISFQPHSGSILAKCIGWPDAIRSETNISHSKYTCTMTMANIRSTCMRMAISLQLCGGSFVRPH